ncbi:Protein C46F11.5 a [Aphelenchoides avenae]|nr:Protein C46F11.5 a [Aphelenchus avenae]
MSLYDIDHGQEEEAFWCSAAASSCVLVSPVYSYNQVNHKIFAGLRRIGEAFKYLVQLLIVRPLIRIYDVLKYIVLFKWVPVLWRYLRSLASSFYSRLDGMILRHARAFFSRVISVLRYWVCFHWVADLNNWLATNVYAPLKRKLLTLKNGVIYTIYGYWLRPLGRYLLGVGIRVSKAFLGLCNRCARAIGNSVVWPVLVICYAQLRALTMTLYGILLAPVVNKVYAKYKVLEDMVFIYVLGPLFKRIIDVIPEKNPLAYESDKELEDFIPVEEEPEAVDSDGSVGPSASAHLSSDDEGFLAKGLHHIDITDSDTSNEEFFIYPKTRRRKRVKEPVQP